MRTASLTPHPPRLNLIYVLAKDVETGTGESVFDLHPRSLFPPQEPGIGKSEKTDLTESLNIVSLSSIRPRSPLAGMHLSILGPLEEYE